MTITCEEFLNELEESEKTLSDGLFGTSIRAVREMALVAGNAKELLAWVNQIVQETPDGELADRDGRLMEHLENAQNRLSAVQDKAHHTAVFGAFPMLHRAAFYLLQCRYVLLSHDAPDCAISAPTMRRIGLGEVFSAVLGGPWAVASLLKN